MISRHWRNTCHFSCSNTVIHHRKISQVDGNEPHSELQPRILPALGIDQTRKNKQHLFIIIYKISWHMFLQIDCFDCFKVQRNESLVQHCFKLLNFNILLSLGNYKK